MEVYEDRVIEEIRPLAVVIPIELNDVFVASILTVQVIRVMRCYEIIL